MGYGEHAKGLSECRDLPQLLSRKGSQEKDLFVQEGNTVILIECKNTRIRSFKGTGVDLLNFQRDFKHSVQFGYDQALG